MLALGIFSLAMLLVERAAGRAPGRYRSKSFRTDTAYAVFYLSGLYALLVWGPVYRVLDGLVRAYAPFVRTELLAGMPAAQCALFVVVTDLLGYWKHRWMHANPFLWAFHSVHHSPASLTFLTSYRFHAVDELLNSLLRFVPGLLLGVPSFAWAPLIVVMTWYQSIQHSDTDWSYGRLDRVLVSSRFHNVHHSTEPAHYNRNFGLLLSSWDVLFGTAVAAARRPAAYGIGGMTVPESFSRQLVFPFAVIAAELARARRRA